jgi:hypothetical protein
LPKRADAVRYQEGHARIVFDWKSDVDPEAAARASYRQQSSHYVHALGADRGAVVHMTSGHIDWVDAAAGARTALFEPGLDPQSDI